MSNHQKSITKSLPVHYCAFCAGDGETVIATKIMPQSNDCGASITWEFCCDTHASSWWDGTDWNGSHLEFELPKVVAPLEQKLEAMLAVFAVEARSRLKKSIILNEFPETWLADKDSFMLQKAILDSLCQDRPFKARSSEIQKIFDNLHSII